MYPGEAGLLGSEAAGLVTAVGPEATGIAVGDRVTGMIPGRPRRHRPRRRAVRDPCARGVERRGRGLGAAGLPHRPVRLP
ncbi:alcohol dehydrogenase catalytic domain-containing protein [Streptomyces diastaticus]